MRIVTYAELPAGFFRRKAFDDAGPAAAIVAEVRETGDRALIRYTMELDGADVRELRIGEAEKAKARKATDGETLEALERAARNIERFAARQMKQLRGFEFQNEPGVFTGQRIVPLERVGVYAPGGRFPLASTVLMCAVPAKVAGVKEIALCSPPGRDGSVHPAILAAAGVAGIDEVYRVGGAQAVAAMAYGTESIRAVDKIVGPGNKFVTAAKKIVFGDVGIDLPAGPSEVMVIADDSARPELAAADLAAQAEHDESAEAVLVTTSRRLAEAVSTEIEKLLGRMKTRETAQRSLERGGLIILVDSLESAVAVAEKKGPEHLELMVEDPGRLAVKLSRYGTLFIGDLSTVALGDYTSGLNHTLPTGGAARYTSGLGVADFLKRPTTLRVTREGLRVIGPPARNLAALEGLDGHARSLEIRLEDPPGDGTAN